MLLSSLSELTTEEVSKAGAALQALFTCAPGSMCENLQFAPIRHPAGVPKKAQGATSPSAAANSLYFLLVGGMLQMMGWFGYEGDSISI
jgi:hypothetical protein